MCLHVSMRPICVQVPTEAGKGHWIFWNWRPGGCEPPVWELWIKPGHSARAARAISSCTIAPACLLALPAAPWLPGVNWICVPLSNVATLTKSTFPAFYY